MTELNDRDREDAKGIPASRWSVWYQKLRRLREHPHVSLLLKWGRRVAVLTILAVVAFQLMEIGWGEVLANLPRQPLFYVLFFLLFISLPVAEVLIYRQLWAIRPLAAFRTFIIKRFYNEEFVGYSGEFYLFTWARQATGLGEKEIIKDIRDSSILSAITSNSVALFLILILLFSGVVDAGVVAGEWIREIDLLYGLGVVLALILLAVVLYMFRTYLFRLPPSKALPIFAIYMGRFLIHNALMVLQWTVVLPMIPLTTWLIYVTVDIVIKRIPLLPGKELAFVWAGIELSKVMDVATAGIAGMLLVQSVLNKLVHFLLFLIFQTQTQTQTQAQTRAETQTQKKK